MNPSEQTNIPRILAVFPSMLPSATIYIIKPFTELAKNNKVKFDYAFEYDVTLAQVQWADFILFSRNIETDYA
jgi:hypothetical protein